MGALGVHFVGATEDQACCPEPPDPQGAVGPAHVLTATNGMLRVHPRDGSAETFVSTATFWGTLAPQGSFDPRVAYDPYGGRFIVTELCCANPTKILLAASKSSNLTDPGGIVQNRFFRLAFNADTTPDCSADYDMVGFNKDWIAVTLSLGNSGSGQACARSGRYVYVFDKAQVYAGSLGTPTVIGPVSNTNGGGDDAMVPALTYSNTESALYIVNEYSRFAGTLQVRKLTGPVGSPTLSDPPLLVSSGALGGWADPCIPSPCQVPAPQAGGAPIPIWGTKVENVVYRNGALWLAQTVALPAIGPTHTSVQWWQIDPASPIPLQVARIDDPTGYVFRYYPSIAANVNNDVLIGYSASTRNDYAGAYYAWRAAGEPLNTAHIDNLLKSGETAWTNVTTPGRWGDLSETVIDPMNDRDMWTLQEYATLPSGHWGVFWGQIDFRGQSAQFAAALPSPRDETSAAWFGGKLYAFGGRISSVSTALSNQIVRYDPATGVVDVPKTLPSVRRCTAAIATGSTIFVIGGATDNNVNLRSVVSFNPTTLAVSDQPLVLPTARNCAAAVWTGSVIYVFGGCCDASGNYQNTIVKLTPSGSTVSATTLPLSGGPFGTLAKCCWNAVWNPATRKAYLFGGDGGTGYSNQILVWDEATNTVSISTAKLPIANSFSSAVWDSTNSVAYLFGGFETGGTFNASIVKYAPATNTVTVLHDSLDTARGLTAAAWTGSSAYVVGGTVLATGVTREIVKFTPS